MRYTLEFMLLSYLLVSGCSDEQLAARSATGGVVEFESKAHAEQRFIVTEGERVFLHCYCPFYSVRRERDAKELALSIGGRFVIQGYHGSPEDAGVRQISSKDLEFHKIRSENRLLLNSPERLFLHHALIVDEIQVVVPWNVELTVQQISRNQLEERGRERAQL